VALPSQQPPPPIQEAIAGTHFETMKSTYDHGTVGDIRSAMGKPEKPDSGTELQAEGVEH